MKAFLWIYLVGALVAWHAAIIEFRYDYEHDKWPVLTACAIIALCWPIVAYCKIMDYMRGRR